MPAMNGARKSIRQSEEVSGRAGVGRAAFA
jgi:hypothetical protein